MTAVLAGVEQQVYELLLGGPRSVGELRSSVAADADAVLAGLSSLESRALVVRLPGEPARYDVRHPQEAFAPLVAAQQERVRSLSALADAYAQRYTSSRRASMSLDVVEVLTDVTEVERRYRRMQETAVHGFRALDRPPYASDPE